MEKYDFYFSIITNNKYFLQCNHDNKYKNKLIGYQKNS